MSEEICYCRELYNLPEDVPCMKNRCGRYRMEKRKEEEAEKVKSQEKVTSPK